MPLGLRGLQAALKFLIFTLSCTQLVYTHWKRAFLCMREIWCQGLFYQKWNQEIHSILVSYTEGVLNIDGADAGRESSKTERYYFLFPLSLTWLFSGIHFVEYEYLFKSSNCERVSEYHLHLCEKKNIHYTVFGIYIFSCMSSNSGGKN